MPPRERPASRSAWFAIGLAMTSTPFLDTIVAYVVAGNMTVSPALPTLRLVFVSLAAACAATAVVLLARVPRVPVQVESSVPAFAEDAPAPPTMFMTRFLTGASLAEVAAIDGFVLVFLGAPWTTCAAFGAVTVVIMLGVALPSGLRYWSELERDGEGAGGAPAIE